MNKSLSSHKSSSDLTNSESNHIPPSKFTSLLPTKSVNTPVYSNNTACGDWGYFIDLDTTGFWNPTMIKTARQIVRSTIGNTMYIIKEEEESGDIIQIEEDQETYSIFQKILLRCIPFHMGPYQFKNNQTHQSTKKPKWVIWKKTLPTSYSYIQKISISVVCAGFIVWMKLCSQISSEKNS